MTKKEEEATRPPELTEKERERAARDLANRENLEAEELARRQEEAEELER